MAITKMLLWVSLSTGKYYEWKQRKECENAHNGLIPKSHWILPWEKEAIRDYRLSYPEEGYRRLCYMALDDDAVAVSPSTFYRVLKELGLLQSQWQSRHQKAVGSGFNQPTKPHEHWHLDVSYINFKGTFVYLACLIDGYSRTIVHWSLRTSMEALDVEIMMERARAKYPGVNPILITDNGPQFISRDFKEYLKEVGIAHRKTRFFYPQSNGKIERFYRTCKNELIRRQSFLNLEELEKEIENYIIQYNHHRLHSSIGYITPIDMMNDKQKEIFKERKEKLQRAKESREKSRLEKAA